MSGANSATLATLDAPRLVQAHLKGRSARRSIEVEQEAATLIQSRVKGQEHRRLGIPQKWRRGYKHLSNFFVVNRDVLTDQDLPGKTEDISDPDCDTLLKLYQAQRVEHDLHDRQDELARLEALGDHMKGEPEHKASSELLAEVTPAVQNSLPHMQARVKALEDQQTLLAKRRANRLNYGIQVSDFESTVNTAIELCLYPVPEVDTPKAVRDLINLGDGQADELEKPAPDGAGTDDKGEAAYLVMIWRHVLPALLMRSSDADGTAPLTMEHARLLAECAALNRDFHGWENKASALVGPEAFQKDPAGQQKAAELAFASLPEGEAHRAKAVELNAKIKDYDDAKIKTLGAGRAGPTVASQSGVPTPAEMQSSIDYVRDKAQRLANGQANGQGNGVKKDPNGALMVTKRGNGLAEGEGAEVSQAWLRSYQPEPPPPQLDADQLSDAVIRKINHIRTQPKIAAIEYRARLAGCYEGQFFKPPWGGKPYVTKEGHEAMEDLLETLEHLEPMEPLQPLAALKIASRKLGEELAGGVDRAMTSHIEWRLSTVGTWAGAAGEAVTYGHRLPEAIVTDMLLSDGDWSRSKRTCCLSQEVNFAAFSMVGSDARGSRRAQSVMNDPRSKGGRDDASSYGRTGSDGIGTMLGMASSRISTASKRSSMAASPADVRDSTAGAIEWPIGVISLLSDFYPLLKVKEVECQGPLKKNGREMSDDFQEIFDAMPSFEARALVMEALDKGRIVALASDDHHVDITIKGKKGKVVSTHHMEWKMR